MDILEYIKASRETHPCVDLSYPSVMDMNLRLIHAAIIASEDLLREAINYSSGELKSYYERHLEEETGHATWLADDIGLKQSKYPDPGMMAMVGTQFYLIRYLHPCALLGYIACLECLPMSSEMLAYLQGIHGEEKLKTLAYHAEHDIEHGNDVLSFIETLPKYEKSLVFDNVVRTEVYLKSLSASLSAQGNLNG